MSHKFAVLLVLSLLASVSVGCGARSNAPPAEAKQEVKSPSEPKTQPAPEPKSEVPSEKSVATKPVEKAVKAPETKPITVDPKLQAAASKLAKKSATGGWTIDETSAGELAKLSDTSAIESLVPLLGDRSADVRRGAAFHLLGRFNPDSEALRTAFLKLLDDEDRTIRGIALQGVQKQRPEQTLAMLERLVKIVSDTKEETTHRAAAARIIGSLGPAASSAVAAIGDSAAGDRTPQIRNVCLSVISKIASVEEAVGIYRRTLADPEGSVRRATLSKLSALGPEAAGAADEIVSLLDDTDASTRVSAADTLVRIGEPAVQPLAKKLASPNPRTREAALFALGNLGPLSVAALPAMRKCLNDSDPAVKQLAAAVLPAIEAASK